MNKSLKTVGYLTVLKIAGLSIGLVYSVLQVRYFGASALVDAFFVATSAVYLVMSLTQGGQLAEVFLPEYLKRKEKSGKVAAAALLSAVLNRMMAFLFLGLCVLYVVAPLLLQIMGPGLEETYRQLSISIFRVSLILILFNVIASFVNTTLNAEQVYGRSEVTGIINGTISITILVLFYKTLGIWVLIYALLAGKLVEFVVGLFFLYRIGYKHSFIWRVPGYNLNHFFSILFTTSGYVGATQVYNIILTAMASYLPAGSFAIFKYTQQLSSKTEGIVLGPASTVFFSKFSKKVAEGKEDLSHFLRTPLIALGLVAFLQFCFIFLLGDDLLRLLWHEKTMPESEYAIAYIMLATNFLGIIFSAVGMVFRKAVVAMHRAKALYTAWTVTQFACAIYSYIAIAQFGVYGLASIPVINMLLMASVSFFTAFRMGLMPFKGQQQSKVTLLKGVGFIVTGIACAWWIRMIPFGSYPLWQLFLLKGGLLAMVLIVLILPLFCANIRQVIESLKKTQG